MRLESDDTPIDSRSQTSVLSVPRWFSFFFLGSLLARAAHAPVVRFVLGGALLFVLASWYGAHPTARMDQPRDAVILSAADVERLRREWAQQYGAPPGAADEAALLDEAVETEVLHREALALGIHLNDHVVRGRLIELGRSLGLAPEDDEEALERAARSVGLDRSDILIRRHLVEMVRVAAGNLGASEMPTEAELHEYYARHAGDFAAPARVSLTHVYLSHDRRGDAAMADAERLLETLRHDSIDTPVAPDLGDPFIRGPEVTHASGAQLERVFGPQFAAAIETMPVHTWAGPLSSSYGLHLVWIHERTPASAPPLETVRDQVARRLLRARRQERLQTHLRALRARYDVAIERRG